MILGVLDFLILLLLVYHILYEPFLVCLLHLLHSHNFILLIFEYKAFPDALPTSSALTIDSIITWASLFLSHRRLDSLIPVIDLQVSNLASHLPTTQYLLHFVFQLELSLLCTLLLILLVLCLLQVNIL